MAGLAVAPAFYAAQRLGGTAALAVVLVVLAVVTIAIAVVQICADDHG